MLSMKEKLSLGREAIGLLKEIKSGQLSIGERLKKSRQRNDVLKKLKVATKKLEEPSEHSEQSMSLEEFAALSYREKKAAMGDHISKPNWYEYEMLLFPDLNLVEKGSNYVVYKSRYGQYLFGYKGHIARNDDYWKQDAGSSKKNGGFGSWSRADRTKARKTIAKHQENELHENDERPVPQNELIQRFLAGEFNQVKPAVFVDVMRDVHSEGLELDKIKSQAIEWLNANPGQLAA